MEYDSALKADKPMPLTATRMRRRDHAEQNTTEKEKPDGVTLYVEHRKKQNVRQRQTLKSTPESRLSISGFLWGRGEYAGVGEDTGL